MRLGLIAMAIVLVAAPGSAFSATIVESTFDSDNEGWRVGDFFFDTASSDPGFVASGGNPGGFIRTEDLYAWNSYYAPASFLGDQSAAYGGNLHLEEQILASDGIDYPMVVISDGTTRLQFFTPPPGTSWTSFDIPLLASAGWEVALDESGNPGPAATEAQLLAVLSNLSFLHIDADWLTGPDQDDLDNVRLESGSAVPEPGTAGLLGIGALALAGYARRRRDRSSRGSLKLA
jgi:hypothetical protein